MYALYVALLLVAIKFHVNVWVVSAASLLIAAVGVVLVVRRLRSG